MSEGNFEDYYQILQVHHDASPEVVQAAYKRLSKIYHPDNYQHSDNEARMTRLNQAYKTLSDVSLRKKYHQQWLSNRTDRKYNVRQSAGYGSHGSHPSLDVLEDFFYCIKMKNWDYAYLSLTEEDKERIPIDDFRNWKEAVDGCFEMQDYRIKFFRTYYNCTVMDSVYKTVMEYAVYVTDMNRQTMEVTTETLHKYMAFDGVSWKVCLGLTTVNHLTLKFRLLADRREDFDPMSLYHSAVSHKDALTSLLSETGFYYEGTKEAVRTKRYHNPFSLIAFSILCNDPEQETTCLCHCANILRTNVRENDILGRLNNNKIICLLVETKLNGAHMAARKFQSMFQQGEQTGYEVNFGIVEFENFPSLEEAVFCACSLSNLHDNTLHFGLSE